MTLSGSVYGSNSDGKGKTTIQPMERTMKARKIPKTDSIKELARFWDTHDLTDFENQLEDVSECVFERKRETVIPVRLRRHEVEAVKRVAKTRGVREPTCCGSGFGRSSKTSSRNPGHN